MAKDIEQVAYKYARRLQEGNAQMRRDGDSKTQVENYKAKLVVFDTMRVMMTQVLNSRGVHPIWSMAYLNFCRRLMGLANRHPYVGEMVANTRIQIMKGVADGLRREVLEDLACCLFDIDVREKTLAEPVAEG